MKRILVVDDVPVVRMVIAKALSRAGHQVAEAGSGEEALAVLARDGADVLVTDVWMPGQGGLGLIREARERYPGLALVAMSGGSPQTTLVGSLDDAQDAGAMVTLMKPVDTDELHAAIDEALRYARKEAS